MSDNKEENIKNKEHIPEDKKSKLAKMSEENLMKAVLMLAWPVIIEMLMHSSVGIADTAMVGRLGAASIAAIGLGNQLVMFGTTLFAAVRTGATVLVARLTGAGDREGARQAARQALLLGTVMGIALASVLFLFPEQGLRFLGAKPEVIEVGIGYLRYRAIAMIFAIITMTVTSILRGLGDTKTAMYVNASVSLTNVVLNYLFIFGIGIFPRMGTAGAGFASMLARIVGSIAMVWVLTTGKSYIKVSIAKIKGFHKETVKRMLSVGIPAGIESIMLRGAMMGFTMIVANLGTNLYAAHQVGLRIDSVAFMPGFGFSVAATTLVGQNLGAKQPDEARRAGNATIMMGAAFMGAVGVVIFIFARQFMWVFTDVEEVINAGAEVLRIMAFALPFMGIARVAAGGLRGAGDTTFVMGATGLSIWLTRIALAYVLVNFFDLGLPGAWIGMSADHLLRAVIFFFRWSKGKWAEI
ncbi:MAG: MATE family efflux transporter, partial [Clostridia bacterium]